MISEHLGLPSEAIELLAKKLEIDDLFDQIEKDFSEDEWDWELRVAVSESVHFLYKDQHFGLHVFVRDNGNDSKTRGLLLEAHRDELPISYHPSISTDLIVETDGEIFLEDKDNSDSVNDANTLDAQLEMLQFMREQLVNASYNGEPLKDVPGAVSVAADKLWSSEDMAFERAREEFYEALGSVREKSKPVKGRGNRYKSLHSVVDLDRTHWVRVIKDGVEVELRYARYDAYSNGSWTDFEEIRKRELGEKGWGETLFEVSDISRSNFPDFFGTRVRTARGVKKCTKIVKSINAALEAKEKKQL